MILKDAPPMKIKALLEINMPRLKAEKKLEQVDAGTLTLHHDDLYDVVMLATGNEELANAYRVQAIKSTWKQRA